MASSGAGATAPQQAPVPIFRRAERMELSPGLALTVDYLHKVLDVDAISDQFRARLSHALQEFLAVRVNQRYFAQVDYAFPRVAPARLFPTRLEFRNPRHDQAAFQNPALLSGAVGDHDPKHRVSSRRTKKGTCHANL